MGYDFPIEKSNKGAEGSSVFAKVIGKRNNVERGKTHCCASITKKRPASPLLLAILSPFLGTWPLLPSNKNKFAITKLGLSSRLLTNRIYSSASELICWSRYEILSLLKSLGILPLFSEELGFLCRFLQGFEVASLKWPVYFCVNGIYTPQIFILLYCQAGASYERFEVTLMLRGFSMFSLLIKL